jgi:hypothetical protein
MLAAQTHILNHPHSGKDATLGLALREPNEQHLKDAWLAAFKC